MQQEKIAQRELDMALDGEEMYLLEKSKVRCHLEGDGNTAYFHRIFKIKNTTKLITLIKDGDQILTKPN